MPDLTALVASVDRWYQNSYSTADKVAFFNEAQDGLSPYFGTIIEEDSLVTVAAQDRYAFPTGLTDISQILALGVANQGTPANRYDYTKYEPITRDDYPEGSHVYFQSVDDDGVKTLVLQPTPTVSSLPIRIRYKKALTALSASTMTQVPDFDARFHDILVWWCCHAIAGSNASADYVMADFFMQKYESSLRELRKLDMTQKINTPRKKRYNKQWGGNSGYAADIPLP